MVGTALEGGRREGGGESTLGVRGCRSSGRSSKAAEGSGLDMSEGGGWDVFDAGGWGEGKGGGETTKKRVSSTSDSPGLVDVLPSERGFYRRNARLV